MARLWRNRWLALSQAEMVKQGNEPFELQMLLVPLAFVPFSLSFLRQIAINLESS